MPANTYGPQAYSAQFPAVSGRPAGVIAGNAHLTRYKVGGCSLDWTRILAAVADAVDPLTGNTTLAGQKSIRFGTVLCKLTTSTFGGVAGKYSPYSLPFVADAIDGALAIGGTTAVLATGGVLNPGDWIHLAAGAAGTAEDIQVKSYNAGTKTITFQTALLHVHGDTAVVTKVEDGSGLLVRGQCFIVEHTIIRGQDLGADFATNVFDGGCDVYLQRVASDYGASGPASNPTRAVLEAGFPTLTWAI